MERESTLDADAPSNPSTYNDRSSSAQTIDGAGAYSMKSARPLVTVQTTRISHFTLLNKLGAGSMGSVFAAYDEKLDRRVALKLVHPRREGRQGHRQRSLREARAVARISHPNVISVHEVGESDETIYIAMEYVEGETLYAWQQRGGHSWQEILDLYLHAGAGLHAAHAADVVHRDFKADNVLLGNDGRVRVADFGVAQLGQIEETSENPSAPTAALSDGAQRMTLGGSIHGTPGYMSPEQYHSDDVDARSDQWSFCAALYEALYGYLPFAGKTIAEKMAMLGKPPLPPPRDSQVPAEIHAALLKGLSVNPAQRFASMAALLEALAIEQGDHAAARSLSRNRLLKWILASFLFGAAYIQFRHIQGKVTPRALLVPITVNLCILVGGGYVLRQTLIKNRFHRQMWFVYVGTVTAILLHRLVAVRLNLSMESLFPLEMIQLSFGATIVAVLLVRFAWLASIVPLLAAGLYLTGAVPLRYLLLSYFVTIVLGAFAWIRAAEQFQVRNKEPRTGSSGLFPLIRSSSASSSNTTSSPKQNPDKE